MEKEGHTMDKTTDLAVEQLQSVQADAANLAEKLAEAYQAWNDEYGTDTLAHVHHEGETVVLEHRLGRATRKVRVKLTVVHDEITTPQGRLPR